MTRGLAIAHGLPSYPHAFGSASRRNLVGVLPSCVDIAELAIRICSFDGKVELGGGVRTDAQAATNVANGTGILDSRHRKQRDGYGHAIDLPALTNGKLDWSNMTAFKAMARSVKIASAILVIPIRQGCDWNMNGIFNEKNEHDWAHFEDPLPKYMPAAIAEMNRFRAEIGLV